MSTDHGAVPGTEGGTGRPLLRPAPVPDVSTAVPAPVGTPVPVPATARAGTALGYYARGLWLNPGRLLYSLYHGKPGSMAEHVQYMKSAAWVPEEMTGKPRAFLIAAGIAYHALIAWPLKLAAKSVDSAADRPLRLFGLFAFLSALVLILLHL